jgi:hypothetical protein
MTSRLCLRSILCLQILAALALSAGEADAKKSTAIPPTVANAPVCDSHSRPKITKVAPDPVKPGDKIMIKGENFGTKECFHNVSFGPLPSSQFKYLNGSTVEATVPNVKPGLMQVNILTESGSSQFIVLVQAK